MSNTNMSFLDALQIAKAAEQEAARFYADAVNKTNHPMGKQLFQQLAEFESYHFQKLSALETSLREKGAFIGYEPRELQLEPIHRFQSAKDPGRSTVMELITAAIETESKAEAQYKGMAQQTENAEGKRMCLRLADEEHGHWLILRKAYWSLNDRGTWDWSYEKEM